MDKLWTNNSEELGMHASRWPSFGLVDPSPERLPGAMDSPPVFRARIRSELCCRSPVADATVISATPQKCPRYKPRCTCTANGHAAPQRKFTYDHAPDVNVNVNVVIAIRINYSARLPPQLSSQPPGPWPTPSPLSSAVYGVVGVAGSYLLPNGSS